jgi:hypothetical protein
MIIENKKLHAKHPARKWGLSPVVVHSIIVSVLLPMEVICLKIYSRLNDVFIPMNYDLK